MRSLEKRKTQNLGPEPIVSSMKEVMQGHDGPKTLKNIKLRRGLS
jgi:hypothetical protein